MADTHEARLVPLILRFNEAQKLLKQRLGSTLVKAFTMPINHGLRMVFVVDIGGKAYGIYLWYGPDDQLIHHTTAEAGQHIADQVEHQYQLLKNNPYNLPTN